MLEAWLVADRKPSGDLRQIAVGSVYRRFTAKVLLRREREQLADLLQPRQLGFGAKGDADGAVHGARTWKADTLARTLWRKTLWRETIWRKDILA